MPPWGPTGPYLLPSGPLPRPDPNRDVSWVITVDEERIYRSKDLQSVPISALPHTVPAWEAWCNELTIGLGSIDRSAEGVLTKWVRLPMDPIGDNVTAVNLYHGNNQRLVLLDRWLGSKLCAVQCQNDPIFGTQVKTYIAHCRNNLTTPSGRALICLFCAPLSR